MTKDYVKSVAKAYGDGDELEAVAQRQLAEIDRERLELQHQASLIRQLMARNSKPANQERVQVVKAPEGSVPLITGSTGYLTDEIKERARAVWLDEIQRSGSDLSAPEVVELMRQQGVDFGVHKPAAAIGTVLAAIRKDYQRNGQSNLAVTEEQEPMR